MPVATSSSGRALYDHASVAFVHNMPLEALNTIHSAIQSGQAQSTKSLAEQFSILQITAFCAIYSPNEETSLQSRIEHWQQGSGKDKQLPKEVQDQLQLPPNQFFTRLWYRTLAFFHSCPSLPSIQSKVPEYKDKLTTISPPDSSPELAASALQIPAGVVEALVLGALKIDEDVARNTSQSDKSNGYAKPDKRKPIPQGLQSARAMCEWILSAYSTTPGLDNVHDRKHLRDQYGRATRLYALEILGIRLQEWEFAGQIVRCAKMITDDGTEVQEREALLAELGEAHQQAEAKLDRHQAAKERARKLLQAQVEKRKLSASLDDLSSSQSKTTTRTNTAQTNGNEKSRARTLSNGSLPSASLPTESGSSGGKSGSGREIRSPSSSNTSLEHDSSKSEKVRQVNGGVNGTKDLNRQSRYNGNTSREASNRNQSMIATLRASLEAWIQHFGGIPAVLLALFAFLTISRKVAQFIQGRAKKLTINDRQISASSTTNRRRTLLPSEVAGGQQNPGFISMFWTKVVDTVRMGTQVTYL